jgi:hypothetical protein
MGIRSGQPGHSTLLKPPAHNHITTLGLQPRLIPANYFFRVPQEVKKSRSLEAQKQKHRSREAEKQGRIILSSLISDSTPCIACIPAIAETGEMDTIGHDGGTSPAFLLGYSHVRNKG